MQPCGIVALCMVCVKVDFRAIFKERDRVQQRLPDLWQMLLNVDCPLCCLVVNELQKKLDTSIEEQDSTVATVIRRLIRRESSDDVSDVVCSVGYAEGDTSLYPQSADIAKVARARVLLARHSWLGTSAYLDFDPMRANIVCAPSDDYYLERCALSPAPFDPQILRNWLDESQRETASRRKIRDVSPSFESLLDTGRFRLVDVERGTVVRIQQPVRYITLSYVWGKAMLKYLQSKSVYFSNTAITNHLDLEATPQTIQDACSVVRAIGEKYLWVDAICIDQSDAEDKHANIFAMGAIYENAYLTIIDACGKDVDAGLTRLKAGQYEMESPCEISHGTTTTMLLPTLCGFTQTLQPTQWGSRAWCFQERALSRQCVAFTSDEVLFYCPFFERREAYRLPPLLVGSITTERNVVTRTDLYSRLSLEALPLSRNLEFGEYAEAVMEYTRRMFTYTGDRLDGFTGIIQRFYSRELTQIEKHASSGLLLPSFTQSLCWDFVTLAGSNARQSQWYGRLSIPPSSWNWKSWEVGEAIRLKYDERMSRQLPSWSWVGWQGSICFRQISLPPSSNGCEVINAANIVVSFEGSLRTREPDIDPMIEPLRVTLHLYAVAARCLLQPEIDCIGQTDFRIWPLAAYNEGKQEASRLMVKDLKTWIPSRLI